MTAVRWVYNAVDAEGVAVAGEVTAISESEAVARVRGLGHRPLAINETRESLLRKEWEFSLLERKVKPAELGGAVRQLAAMLRAGVTVVRALTVLSEETTNATLSRTWGDVRRDVEAGEPLSAALARHPRCFDSLFVSLVRAGEASGELDAVLGQAGAAIEARARLRRQVRSAMAYPVAVLVLVAVVVVAMSIFVVPVFREVYAELGGDLPLPTRAVLAATGAIHDYALVLGGVGAAAVVLGRRWKATAQGGAVIDRALLRAPVVGGLIRKTALARTARTLAVLTGSGVPLTESLEIAASVSNNVVLADVLRNANDAVRSGRTLSSELMAAEDIPAMFTQVVAVGEESGTIDQMLAVVADIYEAEVDQAAASFGSVVEPALIAVLGVVVGGLVLSLYLPMFRLVDLVQ